MLTSPLSNHLTSWRPATWMFHLWSSWSSNVAATVELKVRVFNMQTLKPCFLCKMRDFLGKEWGFRWLTTLEASRLPRLLLMVYSTASDKGLLRLSLAVLWTASDKGLLRLSLAVLWTASDGAVNRQWQRFVTFATGGAVNRQWQRFVTFVTGSAVNRQ